MGHKDTYSNTLVMNIPLLHVPLYIHVTPSQNIVCVYVHVCLSVCLANYMNLDCLYYLKEISNGTFTLLFGNGCLAVDRFFLFDR